MPSSARSVWPCTWVAGDTAFAPEGANVDFVRYLGPDRLAIRTYERCVEGETLSCGTGVLAAAVVGVALGRCRLPADTTT